MKPYRERMMTNLRMTNFHIRLKSVSITMTDIIDPILPLIVTSFGKLPSFHVETCNMQSKHEKGKWFKFVFSAVSDRDASNV